MLIWKDRNTSTFEGKVVSAKLIVHKVVVLAKERIVVCLDSPDMGLGDVENNGTQTISWKKKKKNHQ